MKKLLSLLALFAIVAIVTPAYAEQVTKEATITIAGGSSNATVVVDCFAKGVGKPQANEIMKVALFNTNVNTAKVVFAVAEYDGTYTTIATQDFTLAPFSYINNAPFSKFSAGTWTNLEVSDTKATTNAVVSYSYVAVPYMAKNLRITVTQSTTNALTATTDYKYQVITR